MSGPSGAKKVRLGLMGARSRGCIGGRDWHGGPIMGRVAMFRALVLDKNAEGQAVAEVREMDDAAHDGKG